jgi:hypothetical protein
MSVLTIIGQLATAKGMTQQIDLAGDIDYGTQRADGFLTIQPRPIPIRIDHDETWDIGGEVQHLERSEHGGLLCVATIREPIADLLDDGPWFLSCGVRTRSVGLNEYGHAKLREVSLVRDPAMKATHPVAFGYIDIRTDSGGEPAMPLPWRSAWRRAHMLASSYEYKRSKELVILDVEALDRPAPTPKPTPAKVTTHKRAAGSVTLDGIELTDLQAAVALKAMFGAELASNGSLIR